MLENTDDIAQKKNAIENKVMPEPKIIPVELMSGLGKLAKVVNNSAESTTFTMREAEVEIRLERPVYVTEIGLSLSAFDSVKGMKLIASDILTNKPVKLSITVEKSNGASARFILGKVITSFVLRKESFFSKDIRSITVRGIFMDEIEKFENEYKDLAIVKQGIIDLIEKKEKFFSDARSSMTLEKITIGLEKQAATEAVAALAELNDELTTKSESLNKSVDEIEVSLESKKKQEALLAAKNDELEKRNIGTESELAQKTQTLASTNISISKAEEKLKGLVGNVNVFTEEFSGFVDQGAKQVSTYVWLAMVPLLLLSVVVFNLFRGSVDLSTKFEQMPKIDLLTLFATRLPFVIISALIIGVSVKILFFLINRIIAIHQQRLDLAKITIIAKDVSDASSRHLDMSAEDIYESKTYLKMTVLRAYLSDQIEKFTYASRREAELRDEPESVVEKDPVSVP